MSELSDTVAPVTTDTTLARRLVQAGFAAQKAGDQAAARAAYEQALQHDASEPDALQLLGLMCSKADELSRAELLLRRSLQRRHAQPHVWNNLGNVLDRLGRAAEALECFEEALRGNPAYGDAHYNVARLLHRRGDLAAAARAVERAIAHSVEATAGMLQLRAGIEAGTGQLDAGIATLSQAVQRAPDQPALWHNRGVLLHRRQRYEEALHDHRRAEALGLDNADGHYNRGNTLQALGCHEEALAAYRRTLEQEPVHALALYDLARLRWRQGDPDFDSELLQATVLQPGAAEPAGIRGQLLWRAERFAAAASAFRDALHRAPAHAGFTDGLARCLVRLGQFDEGLAMHRNAVRLSPGAADLRCHHAASLLAARRPDQAANEAEVALQLAADDQYAIALLGLAWRLLGDAREAELNDYQRFVGVYDLQPPPGHADMGAFCQALAEQLQRLHRDRAAPIDQTLRRGTQTFGDIFEQPHTLVEALRRRISTAVQLHLDKQQIDPSHPLLRRAEGPWRFAASWSSRLSSGGFHMNHVHPKGWISSAFYVSLPPVISDREGRQGWLQFGVPDIDVGLPEPVRLAVQPRVGRLVLFPSYFWHGTTPFDDRQERLTIAFDVVPG